MTIKPNQKGIDPTPERENGTVLWLVPIGSDRVVWTQGKGQHLHAEELVWHLCKPTFPISTLLGLP